MSTNAKSEAKRRRRAMKRARKATQQALYESRKREGINEKSKRARLLAKRSKKKTLRVKRHAKGACGNVGCPTCNPM